MQLMLTSSLATADGQQQSHAYLHGLVLCMDRKQANSGQARSRAEAASHVLSRLALFVRIPWPLAAFLLSG